MTKKSPFIGDDTSDAADVVIPTSQVNHKVLIKIWGTMCSIWVSCAEFTMTFHTTTLFLQDWERG